MVGGVASPVERTVSAVSGRPVSPELPRAFRITSATANAAIITTTVPKPTSTLLCHLTI